MAQEENRYHRSPWPARLAVGGAAATVLLLIFVIWNPSGERAAPIRPQKLRVLEILAVRPPPQPPAPRAPVKPVEPASKQNAPPSPVREALLTPPKNDRPPLPAPPNAPPALGAAGLAIPGLSGPEGLGAGLAGTGLGPGSGGGGSGDNGVGAFVAAIRDKLLPALARDETTRFGNYQIRLGLRFSNNGQLQACTPLDSSGDPNLDRALCRVAEEVKIYAPPPEDHRGQTLVVRVGATRPAG